MEIRTGLSRRGFVGGMAATLGAFTFKPGRDLWAEAVSQGINPYQQQDPEARYDVMAKLANNENPYGPPTSVLKAMNHAMKYANRYGNPDGGIGQAIVDHHGVKRENLIMSSGSGELLTVITAAFLEGGKKVVGAEPTTIRSTRTPARSSRMRSRCRCSRIIVRTFRRSSKRPIATKRMSAWSTLSHPTTRLVLS